VIVELVERARRVDALEHLISLAFPRAWAAGESEGGPVPVSPLTIDQEIAEWERMAHALGLRTGDDDDRAARRAELAGSAVKWVLVEHHGAVRVLRADHPPYCLLITNMARGPVSGDAWCTWTVALPAEPPARRRLAEGTEIGDNAEELAKALAESFWRMHSERAAERASRARAKDPTEVTER
jgi:hypothetical protein